MTRTADALSIALAVAAPAIACAVAHSVSTYVARSNWFAEPATVTHTTKRTARRPVKDPM